MLGKIVVQRVVKGKYKENFSARFGYQFPEIKAQGRPIVWVHAVSIGEVKAVLPLVHSLKEKGNHIILSCVTETGFAEAKKGTTDEESVVYLPFDLPYIIKPLVRKVKPAMVIITETDFWYHFQTTAKECGAKLILVNGKISLRSLNRYRSFPYFAKNLLHSFDKLCVQNSLYARRFQTVGILPSKLSITGNLKLENLSVEHKHLDTNDLILTLGSTHAPEEKMWIPILRMLWEKLPHLKVYLVPRHPERFQEVANLLNSEKISFVKWSEQSTFDSTTTLILVDTMGELITCFSKSQVAFVGGSLTSRVGGHNLLEPLQYGVPVVYGPHIYNQRQFHELVQLYGAGFQLPLSNMGEEVLSLLQDKERRSQIALKGPKLIVDSRGALEKTVKELNKIPIGGNL
jgi:3-deoxy-D-manno-octulosonic-acid transferase